jgi:hypothetical protein
MSELALNSGLLSCQVLLGLEAHGIRRIETDDSTRALEDKESDMAGNIPYNMGNSLDMVVTEVNYDGDKRDDVAAVSVGKVVRLEGVMTSVGGGVQEDEVSMLGGLNEGVDESVEVVELGDPVSNLGPAHQENSCRDVVGSDGGGCEEIFGDRIGPKFLRTKKGDLCVDGSVNTKAGEAHLTTKTKKICLRNTQ